MIPNSSAIAILVYSAKALTLFLAYSAVALGSPAVGSDASLPNLGTTVRVGDLHAVISVNDQHVKWAATVFAPTATDFLRIRIYVRGHVADTGWQFIVLDSANNIRDRVISTDFQGELDRRFAWTTRIPGRTASVQLIAGPNVEISGVEVGVDQYIYQFQTPTVQNFVGGRDDREDLVLAYGKTSDFYHWGRPVAELTFVSKDTQKETNCSAFLVNKTILVTNAHCVSEPWQTRTATATLGYETKSTDEQDFQIAKIIVTDRDLDYTLLRIDGNADSWGFVEFGRALHPHQKLILIQQPNGGPKKIAVRKCEIESLSAPGITDKRTDFFHLCDTEGGSSGSPVMDSDTGLVVGLHQGGQWNPIGHDFHNLGVHSDLILKDIARSNPIVCSEIKACADLASKSNSIPKTF